MVNPNLIIKIIYFIIHSSSHNANKATIIINIQVLLFFFYRIWQASSAAKWTMRWDLNRKYWCPVLSRRNGMLIKPFHSSHMQMCTNKKWIMNNNLKSCPQPCQLVRYRLRALLKVSRSTPTLDTTLASWRQAGTSSKSVCRTLFCLNILGEADTFAFPSNIGFLMLSWNACF